MGMLSDVILKNKKDYNNTKQVRRYLQAVFIRVFYADLHGTKLWGRVYNHFKGNVSAAN